MPREIQAFIEIEWVPEAWSPDGLATSICPASSEDLFRWRLDHNGRQAGPRSLLMRWVRINQGHLSESQCFKGDCQIMNFLLDWKKGWETTTPKSWGSEESLMRKLLTNLIALEVSYQDLVWPPIYSESLGKVAIKYDFCQKRKT